MMLLLENVKIFIETKSYEKARQNLVTLYNNYLNDTITQIKKITEKNGFPSQEYIRTDPSQSLEYAAKNK